MGVAAYNRGTALIRRQMNEVFDAASRKQDWREVRQLVRDIERLDRGIREMAESAWYFHKSEWGREKRHYLARGRGYQKTRRRLVDRIRKLGFQIQG